MDAKPEYLGDGVYISPCEIVPGAFVLTTGNHHPAAADNVIVFEPEVMRALLGYLERAGLRKEPVATDGA